MRLFFVTPNEPGWNWLLSAIPERGWITEEDLPKEWDGERERELGLVRARMEALVEQWQLSLESRSAIGIGRGEMVGIDWDIRYPVKGVEVIGRGDHPYYYVQMRRSRHTNRFQTTTLLQIDLVPGDNGREAGWHVFIGDPGFL
jgi:hypothetical protein